MKLKEIIKRIYKKLFIRNLKYQDLWNIKPEDKILILSPHPDDETIGCGGLLALIPKQCDVICLTVNRYGNSEINPKEVIDIRKKEFEEVMKETGVNSFQVLGIEDCKLSKAKPKLNLEGYTHILIPSPTDAHPDHMAVSKIIRKYYKKYYKKVVFYEVWGAIANPTHFLDISSVINKKQEHINMYKSQVKHIDYFDRISALNRYRGLISHLDYAEAYQFVKKR